MADKHWKTVEKEARQRAEQEAAAQEAWLPPIEQITEQNSLPPSIPGEEKVFGIVPQLQNDESITVSKKAWELMLQMPSRLAELERAVGTEEIDPSKPVKKAKVIGVPFYTNEKDENFIVLELENKKMIDGAIVQTWSKGRDLDTDALIFWCRPVMVNIVTGERVVDDIRYDEFTNTIRMISLTSIQEHQVQVDLTTPTALSLPPIEVREYVEHNGFINRRGTGNFVKLKVWGMHTKHTVVYEGKTYIIDQSVANYK